MSKKLHKPRRLFVSKQWQICYEHFLASLPAMSTRILYDCRLHILFKDGKSPATKSRAEIEAWLMSPTAGVARPGLTPSPATVNGRLRIISSFYSWCSEYMVPFRGTLRAILHGPRPDKGIKHRKEPTTERDMEPGEVERFLEQIDRSTLIGQRDYTIFFVLLITGRRLSEITRLRWGSLEFTEIVEANGQRRQGWMYAFQGKGRLSADDMSEWPAECMDILQEYLEMAGMWGKMTASDPLFVSISGGRGLTRDWPAEPVLGQSIDRRFRKYAAAAGIPPARVVHSLRYESAFQRHESNGHNLPQVQRDLRHASILTTMKYIHRRKHRNQGDPTGAQLAAKFARKK